MVAAILVIAAVQHGPAVEPQMPRAVRFELRRGPIAASRPAAGHETSGIVLADRRDQQRLKAAGELIAQEKFTDAVRLLQALLDAGEDGFYYPDPENRDRAVSLKAAASRLIDELPLDGQRAYELQFGATARSLLDEAAESGDIELVEQVARTWPQTEAGAEALWRLGLHQFDHGEPLAAALCFERLRGRPETARRWEPLLSLRAALCWQRAGMSEESAAALRSVRDHAGADGRVTIAGRAVPLFRTLEEGPAWLEEQFGGASNRTVFAAAEWPMPGGNPSRTAAQAAAGREIELQWPADGVLTVGDPLKPPDESAPSDLDRALAEMLRQFRETSGHGGALPQAQPIVVGDLVLVRTIGNLAAFELATGRRRWETLVDETVESTLLQVTGTAADRTSPAAILMRQRLLVDATFGSVSSDGRRAYCIEDFGAALTYPPGHPNPGLSARATSRLAAYDLRTGKLLWEVGGRAEEGLELAGTFFRGPPLPLGGILYCLAEREDEIRLVAVRAETGRVEWSQGLAAAEHPILHDHGRRLAGTTCTYDEGILICPTGAGDLIAIELATRRLLWRSRIDSPETEGPIAADPNATPEIRYDAQVIAADGKVIVKSTLPAVLLCLNLLDGTRCWSEDHFGTRSFDLTGVHAGKVFVATVQGAHALHLDNGKPAWEEPCQLPDGARRTGRGFIQGDRLYCPFGLRKQGRMTGRVAIIDSRTGTLSDSPEVLNGRWPGNLIGAGSVVVSKGVGVLDVFAMPE